jgi:hypothetical protein
MCTFDSSQANGRDQTALLSYFGDFEPSDGFVGDGVPRCTQRRNGAEFRKYIPTLKTDLTMSAGKPLPVYLRGGGNSRATAHRRICCMHSVEGVSAFRVA